MKDYSEHDAVELAAKVARREVSASELLELAIAAVERVNPALNAIVHRMYDDARQQLRQSEPRGVFAGVPIVVKDFDGFVAGAPFTASCRLLEGFVPDHDSEAIARLRRAGFVLIAKTNCPELTLVGTTEPEWRGPTRNPYDLSRSTGGSSGGSAALVAARAVPIGHGGDGGGSLRIPASHCGLVGLKVTRGRVPLGPDYGEGWGGLVQWGGLSRSVRDTAALYDVLAGAMPGDPYAAPPLPGPLRDEVSREPGKLRIAFYAGSLYGKDTHHEHAEATHRVAAQLAALGHHVEEAKPDIDRGALVSAYLTQIAVGIAAEVEDFARLTGREPTPQLFEPATWFVREVGRSMSGVELTHARDAAQTAGRVTAAFHERYDLFLCPTTTHPQVRIGELALSSAQLLGLRVLRSAPVPAVMRKVMSVVSEGMLERTPNTQLFNQTGQPAISLPLAQASDGMPIGLQLAAALGREDLLIRVAAQLEAAHPWSARRPKVLA